MSYHGFGLVFAPTAQLPAVNTSTPVQQTQEIPAILKEFKIVIPESQPYVQPTEPAGPIVSATEAHRAPSVEGPLPSNYSATGSSCAPGQMKVPIQSGKPGYPGFLCVDFAPMTVEQQIHPVIKAFTAASTGGKVDLVTQPTAGGMAPAAQFPGTQAPGSFTNTQQPAGTVDAASFAAACKQYGGAMGTPNCCKVPDGSGGFVSLGLQGGQLVQVTQCDRLAVAGALLTEREKALAVVPPHRVGDPALDRIGYKCVQVAVAIQIAHSQTPTLRRAQALAAVRKVYRRGGKRGRRCGLLDLGRRGLRHDCGHLATATGGAQQHNH